jgi:hypothetical protein
MSEFTIDCAILRRMPLIVLLIILIVLFGGGGYYVSPGFGYYGGGGKDLHIAVRYASTKRLSWMKSFFASSIMLVGISLDTLPAS